MPILPLGILDWFVQSFIEFPSVLLLNRTQKALESLRLIDILYRIWDKSCFGFCGVWDVELSEISLIHIMYRKHYKFIYTVLKSTKHAEIYTMGNWAYSTATTTAGEYARNAVSSVVTSCRAWQTCGVAWGQADDICCWTVLWQHSVLPSATSQDLPRGKPIETKVWLSSLSIQNGAKVLLLTWLKHISIRNWKVFKGRVKLFHVKSLVWRSEIRELAENVVLELPWNHHQLRKDMTFKYIVWKYWIAFRI